MNIAPASTPFPVPSFNGPNFDASPAQFLEFLRNLISQYLDGDSTTHIDASNKQTWTAIVISLAETFLASFPLPDHVPWNTMQEKVTIVEATLEVMQRVFQRVDGIYYGSDDLVKKLFARLLDLCQILDLWVERDLSPDEGVFTPQHMKDKTFNIIVMVLRGLGSANLNLKASETSEACWKTLRCILNEGVEMCRDLISHPLAITFPITLTLFNIPRHLEIKPTELVEPINPLSITVHAVSHVPIFLSLTLEVMANAIFPGPLCHWFIADLARKMAEIARTLFNHCLTPQCATTSLRRAKSLIRIVSLVQLSTFPGNDRTFGDMPGQLVQLRLDGALSSEGSIIDPALTKLFDSQVTAPSKARVHKSLQLLSIGKWDLTNKELGALAASYLYSCISRADQETIKMMKETLPTFAPTPERDRLLYELGKPQPPVDVVRGVCASLPGDRTWRRQVQSLLQDIIHPDIIPWMDDDIDTDQNQFVARALDEFQDRFERPLLGSSSPERSTLALNIAKLPCLLVQCDGSACIPHAFEHHTATLHFYLPAIVRLLDGAEAEVTSSVRRSIYNSFRPIIKHHAGREGLEDITNIIFRGISDADRSVRLSAGYALSAIVQLHAASGSEGWKTTEPIFARLYRQMEQAKNTVRETLLVAVGSMGQTQNVEILGQILCLLISQFAQPNPVIRGLACLQITAISRQQKQSPYALLHPYFDQIAPFIVTRLLGQPGQFSEFCRLMSVAPADFINLTLSYTLPELYAKADRRGVETIARELGTKPSTLLIKHCHGILAHIFLNPNPAQTTKGLNFVLKILSEATQGSKIDLFSVVKSCIVSLLAELVVVMGDENHQVSEAAVQALKKVERALVSGKGRTPPAQDLGAFLKAYMLGLISSINDMLQDVLGKKTVTAKRKILRSLGALITQIGPAISNVSPQIMATFQTMVSVPELSGVTLQSWHTFLMTLGPEEIGPHVGPTSAALVVSWPLFSSSARNSALRSLEYIINIMGKALGRHLDDVVDLSIIPDLIPLYEELKELRGVWSPKEELQRILDRSSSDNLTVATQSLAELKTFMGFSHKDFIRGLASGDVFDPMVSQISAALFTAACRDGDGTEGLRLLAFECIGILGAVDPDRCEIGFKDKSMVVLKNFTDEGESVIFALHLIQDLLVGAFRSTSDIKYQSHLAYSIQELLKFCQFTPALVAATSGHTAAVPIKVRNRWNSLPKHVLETVTPLLEGRFTLPQGSSNSVQLPIYPAQSTYREWIQLWVNHLISRASGSTAQIIFGVFRSAVRNKDVVVAHHLLPHLVLNILISGNEDDAQGIRAEIMVVLKDQVDSESNSTSDKRLLSAQAVFILLDHLNKWVRVVRQEISSKKIESKRARPNQISNQVEEQLLRLDSILSSIDQNLMAKAAFQCKAYARSLMNFEQQVVTLREGAAQSNDLPGYYEKLHEIYAHLDEPDGMEGISTLILSPSLEHQIRQHESTGRWTAAQSCWEVRLQQSPNNVDFHLGLLRCLRNLGHYDTLRTHVRGVLTRFPEWENTLAGFQVESAWMVGAWDDVENIVNRMRAQDSPIVMARLLLAMRIGDTAAVSEALSIARSVLGAPITAAGVKGYRRSYEAVLDLHLTHELEVIHKATSSLPSRSQNHRRRAVLQELSQLLSARLDATLPTFRSREPVLSMRRTAFALSPNSGHTLTREIGHSWLASAKIARKARQWQTAYSAMLQAQQSKAQFSFMESAKLVKATGEPLRALQELENSMRLLGLLDDKADVLDLTADDETTKMKAKVQVLRARWMNESDRFDVATILAVFKQACALQAKWESAHFYHGKFYDECFKTLPIADQLKRGVKMNLYTIRSFSRAVRYGSKYVYQTVPRLLTIWLDLGEDKTTASTEHFKKLNELVATAIREAPAYKWFTAFPQIVSRVGHSNPEVYKYLSQLIVTVMQEYPKQALWLFTSVVKSTKQNREQRGKLILDQLRNNPQNQGARTEITKLISQCLMMTNELLALCDHHVEDDKRILSMSKDFPKLKGLGHSDLIIPLQESLTASLPPTSSSSSTYQPFPPNAPTFNEFADEIEVMRSLAKPRKITIRGSNGQVYMFLGKPKDDLRKDARLMDFNAIINKLLKADSESRRRQLHIRTYGVVTLNEECGFIQWVPNTIPIRPVLIRGYDARRIKSWSSEMSDVFRKIKDSPDKDAAELFTTKILPGFPPVFHDWFIETFPEPTAWLASRLTYGRTAAVMSMVGWILGLGDRHCENILLDNNTGDVVHVDFNCLFEKGKTLETPEKVPFRLTQNLVDGLGVTGVEGVFRIACEVTLQLLRDNKDSLMSVLDAFIHDPLVEWEDEKRKLEREPSRRNQVKASVDLRMLAKNALNPIEKKLKGMYTTSKERQDKEVSISNLVQMLIQEATDHANLAKMYPGWASWH